MKKSLPEKPAAPGSDEVGLLGLESNFKGNIRFRGTLRLDGTVEGNISSEEGTGTMLVINQRAQVNGNIIADSVLISGKVTGNVKATERVEIYRTGLLKGDVVTGDLMVQGGAEFQGQCHMKKNTVEAQPAEALPGAALAKDVKRVVGKKGEATPSSA